LERETEVRVCDGRDYWYWGESPAGEPFPELYYVDVKKLSDMRGPSKANDLLMLYSLSGIFVLGNPHFDTWFTEFGDQTLRNALKYAGDETNEGIVLSVYEIGDSSEKTKLWFRKDNGLLFKQVKLNAKGHTELMYSVLSYSIDKKSEMDFVGVSRSNRSTRLIDLTNNFVTGWR
jgi:hypothetical protein